MSLSTWQWQPSIWWWRLYRDRPGVRCASSSLASAHGMRRAREGWASSANPLQVVFFLCASFEHAEEDLLAIIASPPCTNYLLGNLRWCFICVHAYARRPGIIFGGRLSKERNIVYTYIYSHCMRARRMPGIMTSRMRFGVRGGFVGVGSDPLGSRAVSVGPAIFSVAGRRMRRGSCWCPCALVRCVLESSATRGRVQREWSYVSLQVTKSGLNCLKSSTGHRLYSPRVRRPTEPSSPKSYIENLGEAP